MPIVCIARFVFGSSTDTHGERVYDSKDFSPGRMRRCVHTPVFLGTASGSFRRLKRGTRCRSDNTWAAASSCPSPGNRPYRCHLPLGHRGVQLVSLARLLPYRGLGAVHFDDDAAVAGQGGRAVVGYFSS